MPKIKYLAMVTYVYTAPNGSQIFESENMMTDYLPITENGIRKIRDKLMELHPYQQEIKILGLIPLTPDKNDCQTSTDEDDD